MGLFNLFRPDWQNSDPQVRKAAIDKLTNDHQDVFETVALTDEIPEVRGSAIRKLSRIEALKKIIEKENDPANKRDAETRLVQSIADHLKNFREAATPFERECIVKIADSRFADDLIKSMPTSELRLALVQATNRQGALEFAALKDPKEELAMAALGRLEREGMIQNIFQNSRHMTVRKKAGEKLREQKKSGKEAEKDATLLLFHKRDAIIQQAQRIADSKDFMTNKESFGAVLEAAEELGMGPAKADLDRVKESYEKRRAEESARIEKEKAETEEKAGKKKELEGILAELDKALETDVLENKDRIEALIAQFQKANGNAETPISGLFKMSIDRYNRIAEKEGTLAAENAERKTNRAEILAQLKILADDESTKSTEHKVKELARSWESLPLTEGDDPDLQAYNALRNKLSEKFEAQKSAEEKLFAENSEKLHAIIDGVKAIDENSDFKDISQKLRDSYRNWKEIVADDKYRYKEIWKEFKDATSRFKEMQDWENWHNERDRESLLEEMELLSKEEPGKDVLLKLRNYASQWKSIGPVTAIRINEFRDKFRALFEGIMVKCEPFLKEQEEERKQNLASKEALCEQAESLAGESDENWRDKYKTMQDLQGKWKAIGMVPKENVQAIWDRFRNAENAFYAKHKEFLKQEDVVREENYKKKTALCEQAEKLGESSDWNATSAEFRKLQEDWKAVGPAPRSKSEAIWTRFRTACDGFFDRKRAHFEDMDVAKTKNLEAKEALCAKFENAEPDPKKPEDIQAIADAGEEWAKIGMVPKEKVDEIWNRFGVILDKFAAKRAEIDPEFKKEADEAKSKKESMIASVGELIDSAGSNQSSDAVKDLQNEWKSLPRCGADEQSLYKRFREICDEFFTRRRDQLDIQEQARENNLENKLRLCEEAERLLAALTADNSRESMNEVKQLRRHWRDIGSVPRKDSDKIWNRFNTACDAIFGNRKPEIPAKQEKPEA